MNLEASMRTTLAIKEKLLEEVKALSGVKTKKEQTNLLSKGEKMYLIDSSAWIEYLRPKGSQV